MCAHGDDSDHTVWACQQAALCERGYSTLAIDMRGFGKSTKNGSLSIEQHVRDLHQVVRQVDAIASAPFFLMGWSIGGAVALLYSLVHPRRVARLVLVDTAPQLVASPAFPFGRTHEQEAQILLTIATDFPTYVVEGAERAIPEQCPAAAQIRRRVAQQIEQTGADVAYRQTLDAAPFSVVSRLCEVRAPTLIVVGLQDGVLNPASSFFLREHIPRARLVQFPLAGHAPFLTYVDTFNDCLLRFLSEEAEEAEKGTCQPPRDPEQVFAQEYHDDDAHGCGGCPGPCDPPECSPTHCRVCCRYACMQPSPGDGDAAAAAEDLLQQRQVDGGCHCCNNGGSDVAGLGDML